MTSDLPHLIRALGLNLDMFEEMKVGNITVLVRKGVSVNEDLKQLVKEAKGYGAALVIVNNVDDYSIEVSMYTPVFETESDDGKRVLMMLEHWMYGEAYEVFEIVICPHCKVKMELVESNNENVYRCPVCGYTAAFENEDVDDEL